MISQLEFVRMVDVQSETIEGYIREGKIKPDLGIPVGDKRSFKYFKEDTVKKFASGRVRVEDIVDYFIGFYDERKGKGLFVEKKSSIFCKDSFTRKDVERNIFTNPFKRFEDMRFVKRCREFEFVEFNQHVFKKLTKEDIGWIKMHCDWKLGAYYGRYL